MSYEVWIEEYDGNEEWRNVGHHFDHEMAAIHAGEEYNDQGDYTLVSDEHERVVVHVREVGSNVEKVFRVGAQMEPTYHAEEVC